MRIIANIIVKLLSSSCVMRRTIIVIIVIIVKKMDIKTKNHIDLLLGVLLSPRSILLYYMTIMTIILYGIVFFLDNNMTIH